MPYAARALLRLRFLLGRIFRLETPRPEQKSASYVGVLNEADRVSSLVPRRSKDGFFDVVYVFENELLLEVINATLHAFSSQTITRTSAANRLYFATFANY